MTSSVRRQFTAVFCVWIMIVAPTMVGCASGGGGGGGDSEGGGAGGDPTAPSAEAAIGTDGGGVSLETELGEASMQVPAGAVDTISVFEIAEGDAPALIPEGYAAVGERTYVVTSSAATLAHKVTITLPIVEGPDPEGFEIMWLDEAAAVWEPLPTIVDADALTASALVDHFTSFGVFWDLGWSEADPECMEAPSCGGPDCSITSPRREFESASGTAVVYSIPCAIGDSDVAEILTEDTINSALRTVLLGSSSISLIVNVVTTSIELYYERFDPVKLRPLTPNSIEKEADALVTELGIDLSEPDSAILSGLVFLDFVGADIDACDLARIEDVKLRLQDRLGRSYGQEFEQTLLSADEVRSLDPCRSYILVPTVPFDVNGFDLPAEVFLRAVAVWRLNWPWSYGYHEQEVRIDLTATSSVPDAGPTPTGETWTLRLGGGVTMEFVRIPAATFVMGGNQGDSREQPVHEVTISQDFYIGQYEVTQAQWEAVMGDNPSHFAGCDDCPVEQVSWDEAVDFCDTLSATTGYDIRLPSEAEWEYACRASTTTGYSFGDDESELGNYAWYASNSSAQTHEVGGKLPNPWGLYDMHGNAWEWCEDTWHEDYSGAPTDGSAWTTGGDSSKRVLRSGSWDSPGTNLRSTYRHGNGRYEHDGRGFRVAAGT